MVIWECGFRKHKSQIRNPNSQIVGVSDEIRTRSRRFGIPALSHLSFAHLKCIGKDSNFHSAKCATVLQTACRSIRRPMREKLKILCKNEKGRDFGSFQAHLCPEKSHKIFLSELAKVLIKRKIFPNSLPFSKKFEVSSPAHLHAGHKKLKFQVSVIQLSNNEKERINSFPVRNLR